MKSTIKSLIFVLALFPFSGCSIGRNAREQKTQEWILNAKRPIKVIEHNRYGTLSATRNNRHYTLIDQSGKVFLADGIRFQFPSVIE